MTRPTGAYANDLALDGFGKESGGIDSVINRARATINLLTPQ
jgi:hypothetical protein